MKPRLLVLCTGNSARSQMAEGLFRMELGEQFDVFSAGTKPSFVRSEAIAVMAEIGVDISAQRSKSVDEFLGQEFRYVVTVCDNAKESCPVFPGTTSRIHWSIDDPAAIEGAGEARMTAFRRSRKELQERIKEFARQL
ncbi:MAG: arsenate reductase ArsC [Bryobacteraceae bacterium]